MGEKVDVENCKLSIGTIDHALLTRWKDVFNNQLDWNFRCDQYTKNHDGLHILFMGDSFAQGDGLEKEEVWCYKTYKKIFDLQKTSGYFNIGISGGSNYESIDKFFKYCSLYGNPDIIFFILTETIRDSYMVPGKFYRVGLADNEYRHAINTNEGIKMFSENVYSYFEKYCKFNNIKLYSFSWLKSVNFHYDQPERYVMLDGQSDPHIRPLWTEQSRDQLNNLDIDQIYNKFETYYSYTEKEMMNSVFYYDKKNKNTGVSLWARDSVHPGISFHDFYSDFIFSKYLENK